MFVTKFSRNVVEERLVKVLAVGDSYMPSRYFRDAFRDLERDHDVTYADVDETTSFVPRTPSELRLREHIGTPASVASLMEGAEVLLVQGAPVTDEVVAASSALRLVGCARGGPVNVDLQALRERGITLINTPGKNSEAVADLTIAFCVMLARRLPEATAYVRDGGDVTGNYVGALFMGGDLRGATLGLVGYGQVGRRVATRAHAFGMPVIVYDPAVRAEDAPQVDTLDELLARSDFVSLHARAPADGSPLIDARALATMQPGSFLVNTAREVLVDEDALDAALVSGHLAGAALDVFHSPPPGSPSRLARHANVILTPHLGGATRDTLQQGADMLAADVARFAAAQSPLHLVPIAQGGP
jgi:D-3-phosphoglycerate dehydrogenase